MNSAEEIFERARPRLRGIAYRMLGSLEEAEDVVQDAWLRWQRAGGDRIDKPEAFLVTVTTRLSIDQLRSARVRRETYAGPWLPEPIVEDTAPERQRELAESLSLALLMLLDQLDPVERAVFILREAFDMPHAAVAEVVGKTPANCRQLSRRARRKLSAESSPPQTTSDGHDELFERFLRACVDGDIDQLTDMLAEDAAVYSDGGGKVIAALRPLYGKERISRFLHRLVGQIDPDSVAERCRVNGVAGLCIRVRGRIDSVITPYFEGGRLRALFSVRNPDKLREVNSWPPLV
jgi:RNA polymerase sigma-70 factor (ECF subfamily)